MGLVKFIGEDLFFLAAAGAFACKRLQGFELFETGTVLWRGHFYLL